MAFPDVGAIIAEANQPPGLDVALRRSPTSEGRLTWDWTGEGGDLRFDSTAGYPVLSTVIGRKGLYRFDRTLGTRLYTVTKDRRSTGSQLSAYARDGGAQVEADEIAQAVTPRPERLGTGRWRLGLRWVAAGQDRQQAVSF